MFHFVLLPSQKVQKLESELHHTKEHPNSHLIFVSESDDEGALNEVLPQSPDSHTEVNRTQ